MNTSGTSAQLLPDAISTGTGTSTFLFVCLAVFLSTSTWFTGTAVGPILSSLWNLSAAQNVWLTISVQIGFVAGTILYALFNLSDVFSPRTVFFVSALCGALFNAGFGYLSNGIYTAVFFRFLTGITLAGIYPVGMKIVAGWYREGLGWRLGLLIGALTMGTAFPYLFTAVDRGEQWRFLTGLASLCSLAGGLLVYLGVREGPHLRRRASFDLRMIFQVFRDKPFRLQSFGYFGHMWELYAFWSLVGYFIGESLQRHGGVDGRTLSLLSFSTVAVGILGCIAGGWMSRLVGERRVALFSLIISGAFCLLSGWVFTFPPLWLALAMGLWGFFVIADSPQFSALAALTCPPEYTGTALTIQNGIGFGVTVLSIQLLPLFSGILGWRWAFLLLAPGPLIGAAAMVALGRLRRD
ncbi:MAG: MFS transporter [Candidatus Aminicenantes bacterium]|nr:MFS transporter [Candidatus Aminicenantes bacterium]